MATLSEKLQPPAAATWLRQVYLHLHEAPTMIAKRREILDSGADEIDGIQVGFWFTDQVKNAEKAWNKAAQVVRQAGLPRWQETAFSNVEAAKGVAERWLSSESGSLPIYIALTEVAHGAADAGLNTAFRVSQTVANVAEGVVDAVDTLSGHKPGTDEKLPMNPLVWIIPLALTAAGTWYVWPFIVPLLRFRKGADKMLNKPLPPSRQLPAPAPTAGQPNFFTDWSRGQAALAFPAPQSYDETSDLFATTMEMPVVDDFAGLSESGSFVGLSEVEPSGGSFFEGFSFIGRSEPSKGRPAAGSSSGGSFFAGISEVLGRAAPIIGASLPLIGASLIKSVPKAGQAAEKASTDGSWSGLSFDAEGFSFDPMDESFMDATWEPIEDA